MIYRPIWLTALITMGGLGGCTVFPDREAPRAMDLTADMQPAALTVTAETSLTVDTPQATEPFNSTRILTKPTAQEFQIYGGVRWRDTAPILLREFLIGTLRQSGAFRSVVSENFPISSDLTLVSDLSGFHHLAYEEPPRVVIALYAQLVDNRSRKTLCTNGFSINHATKGKDADSVVSSYNQASNALAQELSEWLADCLNR